MADGYFTDIGLTSHRDPEQARREILAAYRSNRFHMTATAKHLGMHPATLRRIVNRLGMREQLGWEEQAARGTRLHHGSLGGRGQASTYPPPPEPAKKPRKTKKRAK